MVTQILIRLIFHQNTNPVILGAHVGLDPKHMHFALPLQGGWYPKTNMDLK